MMKKVIFSFVIVLFALASYGQQIERDVVSQGGNTIENNDVKLSVTIGETATNVHVASSVVLSEGLEQHKNLFTLSVIKLEKFSLTVYPNPTADRLRVSSDVIIEKIIIVNSMGQEVLSVPMQSQTKTLHVGALPAGMYFIKINQTESQFISKFIKI